MTQVEAVKEDRTFPAVVYGLYLLGLTHGLTIFVGLIVAYANRGTAGTVMETHYTFQIRTFWLSIAWIIIGAGLCVFGGVLSIILVGIPFLLLGIAILTVGWVWFAARCVIGAIHLARNEPYPRPYNWLI